MKVIQILIEIGEAK